MTAATRKSERKHKQIMWNKQHVEWARYSFTWKKFLKNFLIDSNIFNCSYIKIKMYQYKRSTFINRYNVLAIRYWVLLLASRNYASYSSFCISFCVFNLFSTVFTDFRFNSTMVRFHSAIMCFFQFFLSFSIKTFVRALWSQCVFVMLLFISVYLHRLHVKLSITQFNERKKNWTQHEKKTSVSIDRFIFELFLHSCMKNIKLFFFLSFCFSYFLLYHLLHYYDYYNNFPIFSPFCEDFNKNKIISHFMLIKIMTIYWTMQFSVVFCSFPSILMPKKAFIEHYQ